MKIFVFLSWKCDQESWLCSRTQEPRVWPTCISRLCCSHQPHSGWNYSIIMDTCSLFQIWADYLPGSQINLIVQPGFAHLSSPSFSCNVELGNDGILPHLWSGIKKDYQWHLWCQNTWKTDPHAWWSLMGGIQSQLPLRSGNYIHWNMFFFVIKIMIYPYFHKFTAKDSWKHCSVFPWIHVSAFP